MDYKEKYEAMRDAFAKAIEGAYRVSDRMKGSTKCAMTSSTLHHLVDKQRLLYESALADEAEQVG